MTNHKIDALKTKIQILIEEREKINRILAERRRELKREEKKKA